MNGGGSTMHEARPGAKPDRPATPLSGLDYRADLDGMRAIAVISVLMYHLEQSWLPGGYVGVDIFFVLSGYFITRILIRDIDDRTFSLLAFYDRRIRRLLPALLTMLLVVLLAGLVFLAPPDMERLAVHTLGAALSINNIILWQSSGYFAPDAESLPLLHTWSLAVEEQFYLAYPVLLVVLARTARQMLVPTLILLSLCSLGLSAWLAGTDTQAGFYLPFSRFWELLVGGLIVFAERGRASPGPLAGEVLRALGLAAILVSVFAFNTGTPFPGYAALLPCIGTALIIWGKPAVGPQGLPMLARLLSSTPLVFIGLISYSLYLWHWPIFVFGNGMAFEPLSLLQKLVLVALSFALACASWRFIERPLRKSSGAWSPRTRRFRDSFIAISSIGVISSGIAFADGLPERMPENARRMADAEHDSSPLRPKCHLSGNGREAFSELCRFGPEGAQELYIFSDSHGTEIGYALSRLAEEKGFRFTQIASSYCPPALGFEVNARKGCKGHNESMIDALEAAAPATVIVTAYWMHWAERGDAEAFWAGIEMSVKRLRDAGHAVILLGPTQPYRNGQLPAAVAKQVLVGTDPDEITFRIDRQAYSRVETKLKALSEQFGTGYIPLLEAVCGRGRRCQAVMNGKPIYFDDHHVTIDVAAEIVAKEIWPALAQTLGEADVVPG